MTEENKIKPLILNNENELLEGVEKIFVANVALEELFYIENPSMPKGDPSTRELVNKFITSSNIKKIWIYFPKINKAIYTLEEEYFYKLKTARNRNIIDEVEQNKYRNLKVGIAGLSVGSAIAYMLSRTGGPKFLRLQI